MSFPQFSRLLPYRDYNQESGLFMNDTTMGFMLEAIPINGANESIVEALDHMLRTKLPRGIPLCIHLMSSQLVGDRIEYGLREFSWSGEQAERFNAIIRDVLLEDVAQRNIPLSHKKLRRALKAITRSESYLCAMKAGACRYDTEGYVTEHISQEEEAYAAGRLEKIRRQNRTKAELQAVLDGK
ncbi:fertility inhibition protein FinO [Escherichia coli]|nr:fertility inhibition protein FinO [Escherichia coli]TFT37944.1 fertility inhibition protein FinO [Escherichia coli]